MPNNLNDVNKNHMEQLDYNGNNRKAFINSISKNV